MNAHRADRIARAWLLLAACLQAGAIACQFLGGENYDATISGLAMLAVAVSTYHSGWRRGLQEGPRFAAQNDTEVP